MNKNRRASASREDLTVSATSSMPGKAWRVFLLIVATAALLVLAVHANAAASYEILNGLRLGVAGYALYQITDDKLDGDDQPHSGERVFGVGPGLKYKIDSWAIYLNSYYEFGAENRPEGVKFAFRIPKVF